MFIFLFFVQCSVIKNIIEFIKSVCAVDANRNIEKKNLHSLISIFFRVYFKFTFSFSNCIDYRDPRALGTFSSFIIICINCHTTDLLREKTLVNAYSLQLNSQYCLITLERVIIKATELADTTQNVLL